MLAGILRRLKKLMVLADGNITAGSNLIIDFGVVVINKSGKIVLGDDVYLRSSAKGYQAGMPFPTTLLLDVKGAEIRIGSKSRINGAYIHAQQSIELGEKCVVASGVNIMDTNGHELYSLDRTKKRDTAKPIKIGNNVWIGLNATILKGTKIGDNSVVSAGSIVKGDFPANSLISGNPARVVKALEIQTAEN